MSRLRRLVFSLLGAVVIPAVTLVTVATVSVASPSAAKGKAATAVIHKKPCTPFSGCASSVTSSAAIASVRTSHSHCSHGRAKPSQVAKTTGGVVSASWTRYP
jgi:hypothetical protein